VRGHAALLCAVSAFKETSRRRTRGGSSSRGERQSRAAAVSQCGVGVRHGGQYEGNKAKVLLGAPLRLLRLLVFLAFPFYVYVAFAL
jgi:hypothetical protein